MSVCTLSSPARHIVTLSFHVTLHIPGGHRKLESSSRAPRSSRSWAISQVGHGLEVQPVLPFVFQRQGSQEAHVTLQHGHVD